MRVLIDGIVFQNDYQRGVQRYFRELLTRVAESDQVDFFLSSPPQAELPPGLPVIYRKEHFGTHSWNFPLRALRKLKRRITPMHFSGHSLFHSTFFTRSPEAGIPEVVTVYDLIPERLESRYHNWGQAHIDHKRQCMEAANRIICISNSTAADVVEIYPHLAKKVCAIHLGADHFLTDVANSNSDAATASAKSGKSYLLQIGDRHTYKNFTTLLEAMIEPAWPRELQLHVTGPQPTPEEHAAVQRLNLQSRVVFHGPVSDRALRSLFIDSSGFVFPSLYEGFGFPLLEAQSLGVPVICSDIPVFRETAGNSAIFFDGMNPASLAAAVEKLISGGAADIRTAGLENVRRFRWTQCARQTIDVYRSVTGQT